VIVLSDALRQVSRETSVMPVAGFVFDNVHEKHVSGLRHR